jgi:hypothetical protein
MVLAVGSMAVDFTAVECTTKLGWVAYEAR